MALLWFIALAGGAIVPAWHAGRRLATCASALDAALRTFVIASALVVAATLTTGALGRLHAGDALAFEAVCAACLIAWRGRSQWQHTPGIAIDGFL